MTETTRINLANYDGPKLQALMKSWGEPAFRARQLLQWIHQKGTTDFSQMTNVSRALRQRLIDETTIQWPEVVIESPSKDGTIKWLMRLEDGVSVETVYIPEPKRATLCVSSQVGCALNCSFCSTGKQGFSRNLSTAEIIGQLFQAKSRIQALDENNQAITNVVFMGMGEPLLNYDAVLPTLNLMIDDLAYGLSKKRVTVSTSGVLPMMERLKQDSPASLAVSLHAPNDELRTQLVPINKKYPIKDLMALCKYYYENEPKRQVTFEYVMLSGVNDLPEHAHQLVKILKGVPSKINLIPFNSFSGDRYQSSSRERIQAFQAILVDAGYNTRTRKTRGDDVDAACGQLVGKFNDKTGRQDRWKKTGTLVPKSSQPVSADA